ncbi:venom allergen 3 [Cephus cinctus]|uniref:Venom allergen 3 n=1 Tax=Cephus cinctus TaxID=211228 RepID=A0AAJ7FCX2_CEPCN|nr:venom allergen 3 [Cephus cinctus]
MFKFRTILCVLIALRWSQDFTSAQDYCRETGCKVGTHTMCRFKSRAPASSCGKILVASLSDGDRRALVDVHNKYRRLIASGKETRGHPGPQPPATNMRNITWDKELEQVAQRWANQCNFGHDTCRIVDRFRVGQNVAIQATRGTTATSLLSRLVDLWYNEVKLFNNTHVSKYRFEPDVGHYTQMIWADTHLIGCGAIRYIASNGWNNTYLVCNYGPAGNIIGRPIYNTRN